MSLKAKLEAVIYAAEEPVTLAQLASLFAADALEWKTEQEAIAVEAAAEGEDLPLSGAEPSGEMPHEETAEVAAIEAEDASLQKDADAESSAEAETVPDQASLLAETESELKRQAKQRDREVRAILKQQLDEIVDSYVTDDRGVEIREIAGGYRMATKPECHDAVRLFVKSLKPPLKLSLAALETLAVVAYKQPVTAPEVSEIRGVESAGVLGSLLARKLTATAGRKQVIGRPILYKTTKEFLLRFGLKDLSELPSMEEFEKMAAIELEEPGEETPAETGSQMPETADVGAAEEPVGEESGEVKPLNEMEPGESPESSPSEEGDATPGVATEPAVEAEPQPADAPAGTVAAEAAAQESGEPATPGTDQQSAPESDSIVVGSIPVEEAE